MMKILSEVGSSMTGASPVTTILFTPAGRSHAVLCIVVTGLAPVMNHDVLRGIRGFRCIK